MRTSSRRSAGAYDGVELSPGVHFSHYPEGIAAPAVRNLMRARAFVQTVDLSSRYVGWEGLRTERRPMTLQNRFAVLSAVALATIAMIAPPSRAQSGIASVYGRSSGMTA